MDNPSRIVVTGASGWIGRSFINSLIRLYGVDVLNICEFYGSSTREIKLSSGIKINIRNIEHFSSEGEISLYVPLAFQTQDKLSELSKFEYIKKNRELIDLHVKIIQENIIDRAIFFSSGIVSLTPDDVERPDSFWIYKEMKILEEDLFFENFSKQSTNVAACRLFSVSGSEMQDPNKYALGDFLVSAMTNRQITLNAKKQIYRKYVDIEDICLSLIKETTVNRMSLVESAGVRLSLIELARRIIRIFELDDKFLEDVEVSSNESDHYYSTRRDMENLFAKHSIVALDLDQQIRKTASGLIKGGFVHHV